MGLLSKGLSVWVQSRLDPCPKDTYVHSITASPSTLLFQLSIVPDQPQIRVSETKTNPNVTLTLILTLLTLLTLHCNMIGRSVAT